MTKALFIAVDVRYLDDGAARAAVVAAHERAFSLIAWTRTAMVHAGGPIQGRVACGQGVPWESSLTDSPAGWGASLSEHEL
jgi:hypothetical protein